MKLKQQMMRQGKASVASRSLPCLNRNNSIEPKTAPAKWGSQADNAETAQVRLNEFTTAHRKSAYVLQLNVKSFIDRHGIERVGFLTLTFADDVKCPKEAQRRFNSLRSNFLKHHYPQYIRVVERTKTGRIHYHLLVACKENIRRGLNFRQIAARNYKSANAAIRGHWARLREAMGKYGFGRSELMPVKTNSKGLANYIAKYIGKHINARISADKGVRLCQTSQDKGFRWKIATSGFQFLSEGSKQWRQKLAKWVQEWDSYFFYKTLRESKARGEPQNYISITEDNFLERLKEELGSKWAYKNREEILSIEI